ncbi:MAG: gluconate 2-dehydrogenase subunit 3 family protein [Saprospiraceae bacterium]
MNRRDAITRVSLILGGTIIGAEAFLTGCKPSAPALSTIEFTDNNIAFLDEVGETILPTTDSSPGAKAAGIGAFMKTIVSDCYTAEDQKVFLAGIGTLDEAAKSSGGKAFVQLDETAKKELLIQLDKEAKAYEESKGQGTPSHYFTMMKQLTLWGYFSSEIGATKALRYVEVPGKYDGCTPYSKGEKAWAI